MLRIVEEFLGEKKSGNEKERKYYLKMFFFALAYKYANFTPFYTTRYNLRTDAHKPFLGHQVYFVFAKVYLRRSYFRI